MRSRSLSAFAVAIALSLAIAATAAAFSYPASFRTQFVRTCVTNGGTHSGCTCVVRYVEAHVRFRTFATQIEHYLKGGAIPAVEVRAARACGLRL
jgi:hypothetical protein